MAPPPPFHLSLITHHTLSLRLLYSSGRDGTVNAWRLVESEGGSKKGATGVLELSKEAAVQGWGGLELIAGVAWQKQVRWCCAPGKACLSVRQALVSGLRFTV